MSKKYFSFLISILFLISCHHPDLKHPHVIINTDFGEIEIELYKEQAPKTVAAFLSYVDAGYFTNSSFYRAVLMEGLTPESNTGLIQGGIWLTNDQQHPNIPGIEHESTQLTHLSHTNGIVSLARTKTGTGNTEFFICVGDQTQFDYGNENNGDKEGFAAFGKVIKGMDVVRKIQEQSTNGESLKNKVRILTINKS